MAALCDVHRVLLTDFQSCPCVLVVVVHHFLSRFHGGRGWQPIHISMAIIIPCENKMSSHELHEDGSFLWYTSGGRIRPTYRSPGVFEMSEATHQGFLIYFSLDGWCQSGRMVSLWAKGK